MNNDYDDLETKELVELVAVFFENIQDYIDIGVHNIGHRIQLEQQLTKDIIELENNGLWLFGAREQQFIEGGIGPRESWPVVHLSIFSKNNKSIISLNQ